jgi:hypothetical protein
VGSLFTAEKQAQTDTHQQKREREKENTRTPTNTSAITFAVQSAPTVCDNQTKSNREATTNTTQHYHITSTPLKNTHATLTKGGGGETQ